MRAVETTKGALLLGLCAAGGVPTAAGLVTSLALLGPFAVPMAALGTAGTILGSNLLITWLETQSRHRATEQQARFNDDLSRALASALYETIESIHVPSKKVKANWLRELKLAAETSDAGKKQREAVFGSTSLTEQRQDVAGLFVDLEDQEALRERVWRQFWPHLVLWAGADAPFEQVDGWAEGLREAFFEHLPTALSRMIVSPSGESLKTKLEMALLTSILHFAEKSNLEIGEIRQELLARNRPETVLATPGQKREDEVVSARLTYSEEFIPLIGREAELSDLLGFLWGDANLGPAAYASWYAKADSPRIEPRSGLVWWLWYGDAGQGKSRLAYELCRRAVEQGWDAGFVRSLPQDLRLWKPVLPTLLALDYAESRRDEVRKMLESLGTCAAEVPIRLLLLDRHHPVTLGWNDVLETRSSPHSTAFGTRYWDHRRLGELANATDVAAFVELFSQAFAKIAGRDLSQTEHKQAEAFANREE